ncbi:hypothetical protein V2J09_011260 [Rumex salicifolius]
MQSTKVGVWFIETAEDLKNQESRSNLILEEPRRANKRRKQQPSSSPGLLRPSLMLLLKPLLHLHIILLQNRTTKSATTITAVEVEVASGATTTTSTISTIRLDAREAVARHQNIVCSLVLTSSHGPPNANRPSPGRVLKLSTALLPMRLLKRIDTCKFQAEGRSTEDILSSTLSTATSPILARICSISSFTRATIRLTVSKSLVKIYAPLDAASSCTYALATSLVDLIRIEPTTIPGNATNANKPCVTTTMVKDTVMATRIVAKPRCMRLRDRSLFETLSRLSSSLLRSSVHLDCTSWKRVDENDGGTIGLLGL